MGVSGQNLRTPHDLTIHSETNTLQELSALKRKSNVEKNTNCEDMSRAGDTSSGTTDVAINRQKEKVKALQTKIHKNLLKLFQRLKQKKIAVDTIGNRKDLGSLARPKAIPMVSDKVISLTSEIGLAKQTNQSGAQDAVMKTVGKPDHVTVISPLKKLGNNSKPFINISTDLRNSSSFNKGVSHFPKNSSVANKPKTKMNDALRATNITVISGKPKMNNQTGAPSKNVETKEDPYAAIAAGPDHPKLPPNLKVPQNDNGVVPVGRNNKKGTEEGEICVHCRNSWCSYFGTRMQEALIFSQVGKFCGPKVSLRVTRSP